MSTAAPNAKVQAQAQKRIEQLENTVTELGSMLKFLAGQLQQQGLDLGFKMHSPLLRRSKTLPIKKSRGKTLPDLKQMSRQLHAEKQAAVAQGGLAGAESRGEAAKVEWVRSGQLVPAKDLADAWNLTPQALGPAAKRGELFAVSVKNQRYYPREFLQLDRDTVATVSKQLEGLDPSEQLMFWKRKHGALAGKAVIEVLTAGKQAVPQLAKVVALAQSLTAQMRADAVATP